MTDTAGEVEQPHADVDTASQQRCQEDSQQPSASLAYGTSKENWKQQRLQEQLDATCSIVDQLRHELIQRTAAMQTLQAELEEQRQRTSQLEEMAMQFRSATPVSMRRVCTGAGSTGVGGGTAMSPSLLGSGTSMEDKELRHTSEVARLEAELEGLRHLVRTLQDDVHQKSSALYKLDRELQHRVSKVSRLEEEVDRQRQAVGKLRGQVHEGQQEAAAVRAKTAQCSGGSSSRCSTSHHSTPNSVVESPLGFGRAPLGSCTVHPFGKGPWVRTPSGDQASTGATPHWRHSLKRASPMRGRSLSGSSGATPKSVVRYAANHVAGSISSTGGTPTAEEADQQNVIDALRKQLHTANHHIQAMDQELHSRNGLLLSLEQQLCLEMEATSRLEEDLESKTEKISNMAADLKANVDTIKGLQRMLRTFKAALRQIEEELQAPTLQPGSPGASITEQNESMGGLEAHIRGIQQQLRAKGIQLKALQESVAHKTHEVTVLEENVTLKNETITQLERQVANHMGTIAELTQQLNERDAEAVEKDEQCCKLQAQISALTTRVQELEGNFSQDATLEGPLYHFTAQNKSLQAALTSVTDDAQRKTGLINRVYYTKQAKVQKLEAELLATKRELQYLRHRLRCRRQSSLSGSTSGDSKRPSIIISSVPDKRVLDKHVAREANSLNIGSTCHPAYSISPLSSPKHSQGFDSVFRTNSDDSEGSPNRRQRFSRTVRPASRPSLKASALGISGTQKKSTLSKLALARASFSFSPNSSPTGPQGALPTASFLPSPLGFPSRYTSARDVLSDMPTDAAANAVPPKPPSLATQQRDKQKGSLRSSQALLAAAALLGKRASHGEGNELTLPPYIASPKSAKSLGDDSGYHGGKSSGGGSPHGTVGSPHSLQSQGSVVRLANEQGPGRLDRQASQLDSTALCVKNANWLAMMDTEDVKELLDEAAVGADRNDPSAENDVRLSSTAVHSDVAEDGSVLKAAAVPHVATTGSGLSLPDSPDSGHRVVHSPVSGTLQRWRRLDDIKRQLMSQCQ